MNTRLLTALTACAAGAAMADDEIFWFTVDGGGGAMSGGDYTLSETTVGQPDAGVMTGGTYTLLGGYWVVPGEGPCDTVDFNGDGLFPDTTDIDDFLSVFSGGPCSTGTCSDTDFNNDGLFPDTADIDALLSVFSGGPCL